MRSLTGSQDVLADQGIADMPLTANDLIALADTQNPEPGHDPATAPAHAALAWRACGPATSTTGDQSWQ